MSKQVLKVKFFEDSSGWGEKRPAAANGEFTLKSISICNVDFKDLDISDVDRFNSLLGEKTPSIVLIQNINKPALDKLKTNALIRKLYALCETKGDESGKSSVVFSRYGLQCEPVEINLNDTTKFPLRAFLLQLAISMNGAAKFMININVLNCDHSVTKGKKANHLTDALLNQLSNSDNTLLVSNDCEGMNMNSEAFRDLKQLREKNGYVDLVSEGMEKTVFSPWIMWMKLTKFTPLKDSSFSEIIRGNDPQFIMTSVALRSQTAGNIAIPMPRSQKVTQSAKSPVSLSANSPIASDPAIVSAEAAKAMKHQMGDRGQHRHKWKVNHSFPLKNDMNFDASINLTSSFPSIEIAVDELNKNLNWPIEFCVVHGVVLCSESVPLADKQTLFKKFCRDIKPQVKQEIAAAVKNYAPIYMQEKNNWLTAHHRVERGPREWSESCCTIVYQITPREKKFDITPILGLSKDNLKRAIYLLNHQQTKDKNPLHDYAYDYALLFSQERQGYWLIAEKSVPCDIVACRMV